MQKNDLLTDEDRKWKPRNKQAALVVRPAHWLHQPLPEKRFLPSPAEQHAEHVAELERNAAIARAEAEKREAVIAERARLREEAKKTPIARCQWARKELIAIHKRKGLPKPTWEQIRAYQRSRPGYGAPLHNTEVSRGT